MSLLLPRIATFVDPALTAGGAMHDAIWVVETALVATEVTVVVDGTSRVFVQHAGALMDLARTVGRARGFVLQAGGIQGWAGAWHALGLEIVEAGLAELAFDDGATVLLVAGFGGRITPEAVAELHAARSDLRLFDARAAGDDVAAALRASGGGAFGFHGVAGNTFPTLALEVAAGRDAELVIHAARDRGAAIARPPLVEVDRLRVDAVSPHVDEPAFTIAATIRPPRASWTITAYHEARRATSGVATEAQLAELESRPLVPLPTITALAADGHHAAAVTGALVLTLGGRIERVPLRPALSIATSAGAIDVEIIDGEVAVTARGGTVRLLGVRRRPGMADRDVPDVTIMNRGVRIELAAREAIELGEVRIAVELARVTLPGVPETVVEAGARVTACLVRVDGEPLELVVTGGAGALRRAGRAMGVLGHVTGGAFDPTGLWWLAELARGRALQVRSGAAVPLDVIRGIDTPAGRSYHRLVGTVAFELATNTVTLRATETWSDDR